MTKFVTENDIAALCGGKNAIRRSQRATKRPEPEYQRLRDALEQIANGYLGDQTAEQQFVWAQNLARAALKE